MVERSDWGSSSTSGPGGRETAGDCYAHLDQPAAKAPETPVEAPRAEPVVDAEALAGLDDEQVSTCRAMLEHFAPEEVKRLHGLTDVELAALQAPPVPKLSVTRELEKIDALRKTDPKKYWSEDVQARQLALLEQQVQSAGKATSEPGDGSGLPKEVLASWSASGIDGIQHHLRVAQETATVAFEALAEDERVELVESFETALPASVQAGIYTAIGHVPGYTKPASPEAVREFSKLGEAHAELAASWSHEAPAKLGRAQARISSILQGMAPSDRQAATAWFDGLPEPLAASIIRGLSGGKR